MSRWACVGVMSCLFVALAAAAQKPEAGKPAAKKVDGKKPGGNKAPVKKPEPVEPSLPPDELAMALREAYWWQDELRHVAFALGKARDGRVSQWPRMIAAAGKARLPLPRVAGPIKADGRLDEKGWAKATRFPVGPVFGPWREGPMMLTVRACRGEKEAFIAVEMPADPNGLGSPSGELFRAAGKAIKVSGKEKIPGGAWARATGGWVIELAVKLGKKAPVVSFPPELIRREKGKVPAGHRHLRYDRARQPRGGRSLWLSPINVELVPADATATLAHEIRSPRQVVLSHRLAGGKDKPKAGQTVLNSQGGGLFVYDWKAELGKQKYGATGFLYLEPLGEALSAARSMAARTGADIRAPRSAPPDAWRDRIARRKLFCQARIARAEAHLAMLDAPMLFVKRHAYTPSHVYDDYYTWRPGGGIHVLENPRRCLGGAKVRTVIDAKTQPTCGEGMYRDPEIHWAAGHVLFAHKDSGAGNTSIWEIDLAGTDLRRLTNAGDDMSGGRLDAMCSRGGGHHDITPTYLGDDRIAFTSTRGRGIVPCNNTAVDTLHVMNRDGSDLRSISVNNVNEFDPAPMPDGRILYGRWEYLDKTALFMQSLWSINPDGTNEVAVYGNNLAMPTAVLDARPVPGTPKIIASLTPHNGKAVGAIGLIDAEYEKNSRSTVFNFTPEYPVAMNQGLRIGPCDPWPLSEDDVIISNNAFAEHAVIEMIDRWGRRELVHCDKEIACYAPMLAKPRPRPKVVSSRAPAYDSAEPGRFLVIDVYQGLSGVKRGQVRSLRVLEETARTSPTPGGNYWNQKFLISWQGSYTVKNVLGLVPVHADGSAYFEVPTGKALYLQALDADGRQVQSMRTFVQAAAGITRGCIGCHENKFAAPRQADARPMALDGPPARPRPESWGSGYLDYAEMVQPIFDRHCLRCHGGEQGIAAGIDLSGGWTWAFNISYETLVKNTLIGFMNCENGRVNTALILPPRTLGSASAPLARLLADGHRGRIRHMTRAERELLLAWMDTNGNYYGTWDYTPRATLEPVFRAVRGLADAMREAGCAKCHDPGRIGNDWINLRRPERSRILRAPLARGKGTLGLAWCRDRKAAAAAVTLVRNQQPPDVDRPSKRVRTDRSGKPVVTFASTDDKHYRRMLNVISRARAAALAQPRVDLPTADILPGACRQQAPVPLPDRPSNVRATVAMDGAVRLRWPGTTDLIGLTYEVHRGGRADFTLGEKTKLAETTSFRYRDALPPVGTQHYAIVPVSGGRTSEPWRTDVDVPTPRPPAPPTDLVASPGPGEILLEWSQHDSPGLKYNVYRRKGGAKKLEKLNKLPLAAQTFTDAPLTAKTRQTYVVRAVDRRGTEGEASEPIDAAAEPVIKEPVFAAPLAKGLEAAGRGGSKLQGRKHGPAKFADGTLDLTGGGHVSFPAGAHFRIARGLTVECWVRVEKPSGIPVILSCGLYNRSGWFVQWFNGRWRWHVGRVSCDGGKVEAGTWHHLVCTFDNHNASLYQNGRRVARIACSPLGGEYNGPLIVGQYSIAAPTHQVTGRLGGVRIYRRALSDKEAREHFKQGPPAKPPKEPDKKPEEKPGKKPAAKEEPKKPKQAPPAKKPAAPATTA